MNSKTVKAKIQMIENGIAPAITGKELKEMLSSMTPENRRASQRKFRKLWRKLLKSNKDWEDMTVSSEPSEHHLRNRACLVTRHFIKNVS
jgi:hypothetical protein|tara:strand:- start:7509 stop:7778 length:270 start_codon:yes stop_codon:yes gene_type:complete